LFVNALLILLSRSELKNALTKPEKFNRWARDSNLSERPKQPNDFVQLLAALKQPQGAAQGAPPTQVQAQPPAPVPQLPQPQNSFYQPAPSVQQPPSIFNGGAPPTTSGFPPVPQTSLPQGSPPPTQANPLANLSSNILALLQGAQGQQQPSSASQPPPQSPASLPGPYNAVPTLPPGQMRPSMPPHLSGPPPPSVPMQGGMGGDYPGQMMNYYVSFVSYPSQPVSDN
jgi:hypothetical protein